MRCMRVLVVLLACLIGAGCGSSAESSAKEESSANADTPATEPTASATEGEEPQLVVWRNEQRGFTVTYPETWQQAPSPLTPNLSDPLELFALGTYKLRPGGDRCAHQPVTAVEDLGPKDALIVIFEREPPYPESGYPPRSGWPELDEGTNRFCVPGSTRSDSWLSFGESGRAFYALIAVGQNASDERRAQLRAIYDSIIFD